MRKSFQRFLALLLAAIMVMAMTATAFAADNNGQGKETNVPVARDKDGNVVTGGTITINGPTGKYYWYKIASAAVSEGDDTFTYTVENGYGTAFAEVFGDNWSWESVAKAASADMKSLASKLETIAKGKDGTEITYNEEAKTASFTVSENGYYLIIEKENTDALTCTQPILVAIPQVQEIDEKDTWVNNISVTPKASSVDVEKKIINNDRTDADAQKNEWLDTSAEAIGDTVDYVIKSTIPQYAENVKEDEVIYNITDTASAGLTVDTNSIKVFKSNEDKSDVTAAYFEEENSSHGKKLTSNTDYVLTSDPAFKVSFDTKYGRIKDSKYIYIFFSAKINTNAVIADSANDNKVKLEYSNDYTDASKKGEKEDEVKSYTFKFNVLKIAEGDEEKQNLAGAKFELKKKDSDDAIALVKVDNNTYRLAVAEDTSTTTEIESTAEGNVLIKGLDEGTYTLTETKAPDGYKVLDDSIEFTISAAMNGKEYTGKYTVTKIGDTNALENDLITVEDEKGLTLPGTGGIGTTIFTFGGLALVIFAAVLFIIYTRRQKKQA